MFGVYIVMTHHTFVCFCSTQNIGKFDNASFDVMKLIFLDTVVILK